LGVIVSEDLKASYYVKLLPCGVPLNTLNHDDYAE